MEAHPECTRTASQIIQRLWLETRSIGLDTGRTSHSIAGDPFVFSVLALAVNGTEARDFVRVKNERNDNPLPIDLFKLTPKAPLATKPLHRIHIEYYVHLHLGQYRN